MSCRSVSSTLLLFAFLVSPAASADRPARPSEGSSLPELLRGNRVFATGIYRAIAAQKKDENLVFSPFSLSAALAMTYRGAAGETARQMREALGLPGDDRVHRRFGDLLGELDGSKGVTLRIVNRLFGQRSYEFRGDFLGDCQRLYRAPLELLDFAGAPEAARGRINTWVEERTEKRIRDLIPSGAIGPLTRLVLTNAVYFLGDWAERFDPERTTEQRFFVRGVEEERAKIMNRTLEVPYAEAESYRLVDLPYRGGEFSLLVVLPRERRGLAAMEAAGLDPEAIETTLAGASERKVRLALPRFEMTVDFGVKKALQSLGMEHAFDERRADFSRMEPKKELYVSDAFHKAFIRVDEKGTEAAAATAVVMAAKSISMDRPPVFQVEHPFLFVLRHRATGTWLFLGRVTDPRPKKG